MKPHDLMGVEFHFLTPGFLWAKIESMRRMLKKYFGYESFLPGQEEVIRWVLEKRDGLVLMPTGGGKSLCYQLPALIRPGVTLVVSPLIALMKDQVDGLKNNGVRAEFINSSLSFLEINKIQQAAENGLIKILYVAPERLVLPPFIDFLKKINLGLIAVDEAHCISEWGHDFRPDYRNLKILRENFPAAPILALTATATERVKQDIIERLKLNKPKIFISSFNRPNLIYKVRPKRQAWENLLVIVEKHKNDSVIIYCFSRKETENIAARLDSEGYQAKAYHAGLDSEMRKKVQEKFIRDEVQIIVATIAFGMGIDKPDVRLLVHYSLPKSMEGYYQETGRAGRDGLQSECVLFYSFGDTKKHQFFIDQITNKVVRQSSERKLREVVEYCELIGCRREYLLNYFGENAISCNGCDNCLTSREEVEATVISQKIMSAIIKTGERFGGKHIAEVLRGSQNKKIKSWKHDKLSVYGIEREKSAPEIMEIIRYLVGKGLVIKDQGRYPTLSIGKRGREALKKRQVIKLPKAKESKTADYQTDKLFEKLRRLRKVIADRTRVPPYIVFNDVSLKQMAKLKPKTGAEFLKITGVGEEKQKRYGQEFLQAINNYKKRPAPSTYEETKRLWKKGLNIEEIVEKRGDTKGTIINHLEKLVQAGEKINLARIKPKEEKFKIIKAAFEKSGGKKLSPVKEILGEDYSYDELKIARLFLIFSTPDR